jgi:hypothetical protein
VGVAHEAKEDAENGGCGSIRVEKMGSYCVGSTDCGDRPWVVVGCTMGSVQMGMMESSTEREAERRSDETLTSR